MSAPSPRLESLGLRIERLTLDPDSISAPLTRIFRPLLHRIGWRPKAATEATQALVGQLQWVLEEQRDARDARKLMHAAMDELETNLVQVERATVINRRALVSHAAWLRRMYELLVHADRAVRDPEAHAALRIAATADDARMLPPLSMAKARSDGRAEDEDAEEPTQPRADPTRVLELQLDTIDHLMAAAREEDALLSRRRRLLDASRQLLLETSAALALDQEGVHQRQQSIAEQITRINRYEAAGLDTDVALIHQARRAMSRGERDKVFAALSVLRRSAIDRGDLDVTGVTTRALDQLSGRAASAELQAHSLDRSSEEVLGARVVEAVQEGYRRGRSHERDPDDVTNTDRWVADQVAEYFAPGRERATLSHALTVDGCFEVGGVLSPVRIQEQYIRRRIVPFPTQTQRLVTASGPRDIPRAVIHDPRSIILDLAAGRLLTRRYVQEEIASRPRTLMQGEVRVYVLDGSSSMLGPRARMRDAILVAELATLLRRLENPDEHTRVVLYYRYFNNALGPVTRVDSPGGVIEAIAEVTGTPRSGGTDIEGALVASLELIARAQQDDPDLARAQIVLITDGVAEVDEAKVRAAHEVLGDLNVGISVIALGEENEALRELVAHQRANAERAFYHFLPDDYLGRLSEGRIGDPGGIHLPPVPRGGQGPLDEKLGTLLEELVDLQRDREAESRRELDRSDREKRVEQAEVDTAGEGQRARLEALYRDDRALQVRFERWFPRPLAPANPGSEPMTALMPALPKEGTLERDDIDSMLVVLATIAEVVETVGSSRLGRRADAVDLLERLLPNARLTPARYQELLRTYPAQLAAGLDAVHGATHSGLGWELRGTHRS